MAVILLAGPAGAFAGASAKVDYAGRPAAIPARGDLTQAEKARITLFEFARCLAARSRPLVTKVLADPPFDRDDLKILKAKLNKVECLDDGFLTTQHLLLRGALFAALYRADYAADPGEAPARPIDWAADLAMTDKFVDGAGVDEAAPYPALHQFADCAARADPGDARAVVLSEPVSATEAQAFDRLAPHLDDCMPADAKITFSKAILTGLLAEVLYRNAKAAAGSGSR